MQQSFAGIAIVMMLLSPEVSAQAPYIPRGTASPRPVWFKK